MPPIELAKRLALLLVLAFFLGLAFEEVYKRDEPTIPGGIRTFPLVGLTGAMLYLVEPQRVLAFVAGLFAVGAWLYGFLRFERSAETESVRTLMILEPPRLCPRTDRPDATSLGRRRCDRRGGAGDRSARKPARLCAPDPAGRDPDRRQILDTVRHHPPARTGHASDRGGARDPLSRLV